MMIPGGEACTTTVVAVVRASDGVRFVAAGKSADEVADLLVDYISRRAGHVLWPVTAMRVADLIEVGDVHAAIAQYFDNVGSRWDEETLHTYSTTRDLVSRETRDFVDRDTQERWKGDAGERKARIRAPARQPPKQAERAQRISCDLRLF